MHKMQGAGYGPPFAFSGRVSSDSHCICVLVQWQLDGAWISHFSRARVDFPLERGEHPLRKELAKAGLPEPDPERGKLRYAEWLPGELARIEAAE